LEAEDFLCLDQIYDYLLKSDTVVFFRELLRFLPESDSLLPVRNREKKLRRLLNSDVRFLEKSPNSWTLRSSGINTNIDDIRYCVFDLETTGGKPPLHRIIEIGAAIVQGGAVVDEFVSFVQPGRPIPDYVSRLTGISAADVRNAPRIAEVLQEFQTFSEGCLYVAHGAVFDMSFLNAEAERFLQKNLFAESLCTLKLSRFLVQDSPNHKLDGLCQHFNVPIENRHRALGDAKATALLLIKLLELYRQNAGQRKIDGLRKFCVQNSHNYFPETTTNPDLLPIEPTAISSLPELPGVVNFWLRSGRRLNVLPMKNLRREMEHLWYFAAESGRDGGFHAVRKAAFFSFKPEKSSLLARLQSPVFLQSRLKKELFYLKVFSHNGGRAFLTTRKLNDDAFYYGPFESESKEFKAIEQGLRPEKLDVEKLPPKSGVVKAYDGSGIDLAAFLKELFRFSGREASFLLITENGNDGEFCCIFFREGYAVKTKSLQRDRLTLALVRNFLRQILQHFYGKMSLKQVVNILSLEQAAKYNAVMSWLYKDYPSDEARLYFLQDMDFEQPENAVIDEMAEWLIDNSVF
jgi:DNA polymerase III epsilon subunit family exonuclease